MFGRGQWAIFGITKDSQIEFQKSLSNSGTAFEVSQLAASVTSKLKDQETFGINPYDSPRLDEKLTQSAEFIHLMGSFLAGENSALPEILSIVEAYTVTESNLSLGNNKYGFWVVSNSPEDFSDPNSKKEQFAYEQMERPFKFLIKEEKKAVEDQVTAQAVLNRSQSAVLVDFQNERVYVSSSNKDEVLAVQELLTKLGVKTFPLVWDFEYPTWPSDFLNAVVKESRFISEMKDRADELSRFRPDEVVKLDDKQMEKIVSTFFALTELESSLWVGLTTPARVRIHKPIDAVGVGNPSVAFSLLNMSNDAEVAAASVVFQELVTKNTKDGEKTIRKDVFTVDINDNLNLQDAGAALLRGFDLPQFKRGVKTAIKAKGRLTIQDFWYMWLDGLNTSVLEFVDNVTDVLGIDKKYGLVAPDLSTIDEVLEEEIA